MNVTNIFFSIRVSPCDLHNGNYKRDFKSKSNNNCFNTKTISFQEIFEKEKAKQHK